MLPGQVDVPAFKQLSSGLANSSATSRARWVNDGVYCPQKDVKANSYACVTYVWNGILNGHPNRELMSLEALQSLVDYDERPGVGIPDARMRQNAYSSRQDYILPVPVTADNGKYTVAGVLLMISSNHYNIVFPVDNVGNRRLGDAISYDIGNKRKTPTPTAINYVSLSVGNRIVDGETVSILRKTGSIVSGDETLPYINQNNEFCDEDGTPICRVSPHPGVAGDPKWPGLSYECCRMAGRKHKYRHVVPVQDSGVIPVLILPNITANDTISTQAIVNLSVSKTESAPQPDGMGAFEDGCRARESFDAKIAERHLPDVHDGIDNAFFRWTGRQPAAEVLNIDFFTGFLEVYGHQSRLFREQRDYQYVQAFINAFCLNISTPNMFNIQTASNDDNDDGSGDSGNGSARNNDVTRKRHHPYNGDGDGGDDHDQSNMFYQWANAINRSILAGTCSPEVLAFGLKLLSFEIDMSERMTHSSSTSENVVSFDLNSLRITDDDSEAARKAKEAERSGASEKYNEFISTNPVANLTAIAAHVQVDVSPSQTGNQAVTSPEQPSTSCNISDAPPAYAIVHGRAGPTYKQDISKHEIELYKQMLAMIVRADDQDVEALATMLMLPDVNAGVLNHASKYGYTLLHDVAVPYRMSCVIYYSLLDVVYNAKQLSNRLEMMKMLMNDDRVDLRATENKGFHAFQLACSVNMFGILEIASLFRDKAPDVMDWDGSVVNYERERNITPSNAVRPSPLHYAVEGGNLELVKYLVETCGCDVNVVTKAEVPGVEGGNNPLHYAYVVLKNGESQVKWDIVQYLIDHGCRQDVRNARGDLPIQKLSTCN